MMCPTCGDRMRNLLSGCQKPECVAAEIAADAALDRLIEASSE